MVVAKGFMPSDSISASSLDDRAFETRHCWRCERDRQFNRRVVAHRVHLVITIFTLGLWGISWAALTFAQRRKPWRCSVCFSRYVPASKPAPPMKPAPELPRIVLPRRPQEAEPADQSG